MTLTQQEQAYANLREIQTQVALTPKLPRSTSISSRQSARSCPVCSKMTVDGNYIDKIQNDDPGCFADKTAIGMLPEEDATLKGCTQKISPCLLGFNDAYSAPVLYRGRSRSTSSTFFKSTVPPGLCGPCSISHILTKFQVWVMSRHGDMGPF